MRSMGVASVWRCQGRRCDWPRVQIRKSPRQRYLLSRFGEAALIDARSRLDDELVDGVESGWVYIPTAVSACV